MTRWDWEFLREQNLSEDAIQMVQTQAQRLDSMAKQLARLEEALQFYASGTCHRDWNEIGIEDNFGHKAREALRQ